MAETQAQQRASTGNVGRRNDYPELSAVSLRSPRKGEIRNLAVTTSSVLHHVPDGDPDSRGTPDWRDRFVDLYASGGTVYIAFGDTDDVTVTVDETAASVQTGSITVGDVTATRITGHASDHECWIIPDGQFSPPIPVGDALCFAIKGSAACNLIAFPSET